MKISGAVVLAVACIPTVGAFVSSPSNINLPIETTQLHAKQQHRADKEASWAVAVAGPTVALVAGVTLASQVAGASVPIGDAAILPESMPPIVRQQDVQSLQMAMLSETTPVSAISGSSLQLAEKVDYLDFSMPSYGGGGGDSSSSAAKRDSSGAPSFGNPFSDFDPFASKTDEAAPAPTPAPAAAPAPVVVDTSAEDKAAAEAAKKAEKEAAAKEKEEEKAAKEAEKASKKAEKEAAAQKKAAEEAAAATKKAEKEARLKAEKEKQRAAVERANEDKKASMPSLNIETPTMPDIKVQEFKAPDIKVPEFKAPDIKIPDFKAPEFKKPDVPDFRAPDIKMPDVALPKFSMPKIDLPKMDTPSFSTPKAPSFDTPKAPSFSAPSFGSGKSEYQSLDAVGIGEPQEVRDERAKAATTAYKEADASAKEVEAKARELRNVASDKKKTAKAAKDEACKTRFGGKILCIRPFGIGY